MILLDKCNINDVNLFGPHSPLLVENISTGTDYFDKTKLSLPPASR